MLTVLLAAFIAAMAPTIAIVVQAFLTKKRSDLQNVKMQEIHVLVNSRLHEALAEIDKLNEEIQSIKDGNDPGN